LGTLRQDAEGRSWLRTKVKYPGDHTYRFETEESEIMAASRPRSAIIMLLRCGKSSCPFTNNVGLRLTTDRMLRALDEAPAFRGKPWRWSPVKTDDQSAKTRFVTPAKGGRL